MSARLIVIAKAPVPGRSKTRLCPPCTAEQAAGLAEAALIDTLAAVTETPCTERVLVLDGEPGGWVPPGFQVVPQCAGDLGERLAGAFSHHDGPTLLIGMDTPQVTAALLERSIEELRFGDAVLGAAPDGGYWAIGFCRPQPRAFVGVAMSSPFTAELQRRRLQALGLGVRELPQLRDVDYFKDAQLVAEEHPAGEFARAVRSLEPALV
ncbi:MAG: TIGR04282 family arsenosugar biosynthesis glycosyltransferase [Solirubrobacterales bacterium]|nr:TIGR04282 family arsenosugar biosynthesis glycosyltransferase [Solirubrobacterales bacterium]